MVKFILLFISLNFLSGIELPEERDNIKRKISVESPKSQDSKKPKITTEKVCQDVDTSPEIILSPHYIDPLSSPSSDDVKKYGELSHDITEFLDPDGILLVPEDNFVSALFKIKGYISKNRKYEQLKYISNQFDQILKNKNFVEEELDKLREDFRYGDCTLKCQKYHKLKWRIIAEWNFERWPHQSNLESLLGYLFFPKEVENEYTQEVEDRYRGEIVPDGDYLIAITFSAKYGSPIAYYYLYKILKLTKYKSSKLIEKDKLKKIYKGFRDKSLEYLNQYKNHAKKEFSYEYLLLGFKLSTSEFDEKIGDFTKKIDEELLIRLISEKDPRTMNIAAAKDEDSYYFYESYKLGYKKASLGICKSINRCDDKHILRQYFHYAKKYNLPFLYAKLAHILRYEHSSKLQKYKTYYKLEICEELIPIIGDLNAKIVKNYELAGDNSYLEGYNIAAEFIKSYVTQDMQEDYIMILSRKVVDLYEKMGEAGSNSGYISLAKMWENDGDLEKAKEYYIKGKDYESAINLEKDISKKESLQKAWEEFKDNWAKRISNIPKL